MASFGPLQKLCASTVNRKFDLNCKQTRETIPIRDPFLAAGAKCKYLKPRVEQFKHYISCILLQAMQPRQLRAATARAATGNNQAAAMAITTTQITWLQTQLSPSADYVFGCSCCSSRRWRCRCGYRCEARQPWTWPAGGLRLPAAAAVAMAVAADAAHQA